MDTESTHLSPGVVMPPVWSQPILSTNILWFTHGRSERAANLWPELLRASFLTHRCSVSFLCLIVSTLKPTVGTVFTGLPMRSWNMTAAEQERVVVRRERGAKTGGD